MAVPSIVGRSRSSHSRQYRTSKQRRDKSSLDETFDVVLHWEILPVGGEWLFRDYRREYASCVQQESTKASQHYKIIY